MAARGAMVSVGETLETKPSTLSVPDTIGTPTTTKRVFLGKHRYIASRCFDIH